jgi:hypothetical protein
MCAAIGRPQLSSNQLPSRRSVTSYYLALRGLGFEISENVVRQDTAGHDTRHKVPYIWVGPRLKRDPAGASIWVGRGTEIRFSGAFGSHQIPKRQSQPRTFEEACPASHHYSARFGSCSKLPDPTFQGGGTGDSESKLSGPIGQSSSHQPHMMHST